MKQLNFQSALIGATYTICSLNEIYQQILRISTGGNDGLCDGEDLPKMSHVFRNSRAYFIWLSRASTKADNTFTDIMMH